MKRALLTALALFPIILLTCVGPPPTEKITRLPRTIPPEEPLPVDPQVTAGTLENGVRYMIRVNRKPEKRAELRLVVNAGSVLEDDDQQGLAHLAEHMAFNGTRHFAKQELVDYMESIGMRFGPELNAFTSFDETVYMLTVPTDSAEMVAKAFQILEDWAHGISFEDEEIEKERGVVIEEWRLGRGAQARMLDKQFPILFKDSQYAVRLPIGQKAVLDTFHYAAVRRFYNDWYRPDLMAVVAVGDFDRNWMEGLIEKHFSKLALVADPRERVYFPVPDHEETLAAIASDPEATGSQVSVYYKQGIKDETTHGAYRERITRSLYNAMLNERLEELTKKPEAPFLFGYSGQGRFVRTKEVYLLGAAVSDNGIERGLEALLIEADRVARHGFTASELKRQKMDLLRQMERAFQERDKTESSRYTSEYVRYFLIGEPTPGIEYEYELHKRYLPGIQVEEVNRLAREWLTDQNRVIMVNIPEKEGVNIPDEPSLLAIFDTVEAMTIDPYREAVSAEPLVATVPKPVAIVAEVTMAELGLHEWKLANGVRVLLKPTDFKNDEILFVAYSDGGTSLINDESHVAGLTSADVISEGGIGAFNDIELQKRLAGKMVRVSPFISELQEGLTGSSSPQDTETMFQLIYLYFTAPRQDSTAFIAFRERIKGYLENRNASPEAAFQDTTQVTLSQHHYRRRPWSLKLLDEMDLEKSYNFYKDRFADASDFIFVLVGNFDLDEIKPLIQTYLGGLPSLNRDETWKNVGVSPPKGVITKKLHKGIEPKSLTQIIFTGPFEWSRQNRYELGSLARVLRIKLREVLREDLGGTYGVGVWAAPSHYPVERYRLTVNFGCDPERVQELTDVVFEQIDSLKTYGTTMKYLTKVKESQRRERETNLKENEFWLDIIESYDYNGEDFRGILKYDELADALSMEAIQSAARRYLVIDNYVRVSLYPEKVSE
ncbi:MAG: M16 family metallopeptidase [Candidatus Neomarinimicrobiota bacterium]